MACQKCTAILMVLISAGSAEVATEAGNKLDLPWCRKSTQQLDLGPKHYSWRNDPHRDFSDCTYNGVPGTTIYVEDNIADERSFLLQGTMRIEGQNKSLHVNLLTLSGEIQFRNFTIVRVQYDMDIHDSRVRFEHAPVRTEQAHRMFTVTDSVVEFDRSPVILGGYWNSQMWMVGSHVTFLNCSFHGSADIVLINVSDVRFTGVNGFLSSSGDYDGYDALEVRGSNLSFQRGWGAIVTPEDEFGSGMVLFHDSIVSFEENCTTVEGGAVRHEGGKGKLVVEGGAIHCSSSLPRFRPTVMI